ncbi:YybS family protein [Fredinandcohnia sp. 179-A 10B2 NHS]|uniref:YybS family protein n=1 Tax=Fredinandcohnia sp. 179-A 10B2 NHS TaxID=3235176 RepID=UPI0039A14CD4
MQILFLVIRGEKVKNTKILTEGSMLIAVYCVLLLVSLYVPILGSLIAFLLPIPFILITVRHGVKQSVLFLVIGFLLSGLLGSILGIAHTLMFGVAGIVIGELIRRERNGIELFLGATLSYLASIFIMYIAIIGVFQIDVIEMLTEGSRESFEMAEEIVQATGTDANTDIIFQLEESLEMMQYLIPSLFVFLAMISGFITVLAIHPILKRLRVQMNPFPPFRDISFPKSIIWYYLLILLVSFMELEKGSFAYTAFLNFFFILQLFMVIQGLSFIYFYCHQKKISKAIPIVITILTPFLLYIIRILGIIDLGFQLRDRVNQKK